MASKCVHKGCGKVFSDPEEPCIYHPGPPIFHEGQKGWKCCKPRVLTFDEFLEIPPCTTGKHSTVDDTPAPEPSTATITPEPATSLPAAPRIPTSATAQPATAPAPAPPQPETESDEPGAVIPPGTTCRRRACGATFSGDESRQGEVCKHHPGAPIFHEGSKGYTCCKRRVLEFDQFMKIEGCKEKPRHMFIGKAKKEGQDGSAGGVEKVESIRHDFYQTPAKIHASLFFKKVIPPPKSTIEFSTNSIRLDLQTSDNKQYKDEVPLFGSIDPESSKFRITGAKVELELTKSDGRGWPVLRADDTQTGEIIQSGRAGRV